MTDTLPTSLADVLDQVQRDPDGLRAPLPGNWTQGRTAFGGLTAALMLHACRVQNPGLAPLRSALIGFTGPVTSDPLLTSRLLRQGRNVTTAETEARIGDQVVGTGNFSFGAAQTSSIRVICPSPDAPDPDACEDLIPPQAAAMAPQFHHNFDIRLIEGDRPMSGSDRGYIRGWARHRDPASRAGIVSLMCIADILPPAVFPMFPRLGPNSSMTWICNFLSDAPETQDGWWQVETRLSAAADGYSSQQMRIWNSDGDLVVDGMQSVVIFV